MNDWNRDNSIAQFIRQRRKELRLTQVKLSDTTGVGLRFVRELEQGKPNLMTNKINQVLLFFGHELSTKPISDSTGRNMGK
ncbi:helix-turn-helix transcriptional regulator [Kriegella aquimaris]|uniref:Transcriptional regulator, y4mF family n=1 Tax=Kriegella aquimaris TaxID=192904 RepID=A0A1G9RET5_9FLAO|nr:helix-turn-helix transcriptional regulator [Kriegella aquimaris]SDM21691.1 transcriptional regulator, y4mF family [Kriegella aquimaris]